MKVLYVHGDDYAAVSFEENFSENDYLSLWNEAQNKTVAKESDEYYIEIEAYDFGKVDEKFIDFVREEIQDYDMSKHANFYIVNEKKSSNENN